MQTFSAAQPGWCNRSTFSISGSKGSNRQDVSGFFTVIGSIVSIESFIWSHVAHRAVVAGIRAGRIQ